MKHFRPLFALLLFALLGIAFAGETTTQEVESAALDRSWPFRLYLPDGYESSSLEYPVIYLLHGSGGNETSWDEGIEIIDSLVQEGHIPPVIAVAPASGRSWWTDSVEPFESAFIEDLIPYVDANWRTIAEREGRAVAGYSMGGYGAVRYALAYPETFGAATALRPALYDQQPPPDSSARTTGAFGDPYEPDLWDERNYPALLDAYAESGLEVPMFIAVGDDDWNEPAGWEFNVEYQSALLYERLAKQHESPAELRVMDGGPDWELWGPAFEEALAYMAESLRYPRAAQ